MQIGRYCLICQELYYVDYEHDGRRICPECLTRLKQILYPKKKEK